VSGELEGQVAIVTGGGRGIGRAIAQRLAAEGAAVAVTSRTSSQLEETVAAIESAGGRALAITADVVNREDVERVVAETESEFGPVDILVNNAAVGGPKGPLWELEPEAWREAVEVDLFGPFLVTRVVLPGMIERRQGRIINVSSGASVWRGGWAGGSAYAASKAALNSMTETLATEVEKYGVSVFGMFPGAVRTQLLSNAVSQPSMEELTPGRGKLLWDWNTPIEEPASLCLYLASGKADALSGTIINVSDDVEELVKRSGEVDEQDLYRVRVRKLDGK
jgi:NAD(P)-dependent dehydrogenase (short-subunit alcohol dehydrogenase family)